MSLKFEIIAGKAFKIDAVISSKDIISTSITESYHSGHSMIPFVNKINNFTEEVFSKSILVVGENFSYGSSNEMPAISLKKNGVNAIIAKSFFPCFYKNAYNIGLLCINANTDYIDDDDDLKIDLIQNFIQNKTKQLGIKIKPIKKYFYNLYLNGGLLNTIFKEGV